MRLIANGVIKKIEIIIKLDKNVLDKVLRPSSSFLIFFFLIANESFFLKYFDVPEKEVSFFLIIILQSLLLPQANNGTKGFAHLV